jgi:hypothetical protein
MKRDSLRGLPIKMLRPALPDWFDTQKLRVLCEPLPREQQTVNQELGLGLGEGHRAAVRVE